MIFEFSFSLDIDCFTMPMMLIQIWHKMLAMEQIPAGGQNEIQYLFFFSFFQIMTLVKDSKLIWYTPRGWDLNIYSLGRNEEQILDYLWVFQFKNMFCELSFNLPGKVLPLQTVSKETKSLIVWGGIYFEQSIAQWMINLGPDLAFKSCIPT